MADFVCIDMSQLFLEFMVVLKACYKVNVLYIFTSDDIMDTMLKI